MDVITYYYKPIPWIKPFKKRKLYNKKEKMKVPYYLFYVKKCLNKPKE